MFSQRLDKEGFDRLLAFLALKEEFDTLLAKNMPQGWSVAEVEGRYDIKKESERFIVVVKAQPAYQNPVIEADGKLLMGDLIVLEKEFTW